MVGYLETCLRRPVGVSLLMLALLMAGALAFRVLPVASLPQVDYPTIMVTAELPGAEPQTMATAVAAPLERRIGQIAGITELTSTSLLGIATVVVQFELNRPINAAARDVQAAINAAAPDLPAGMSHPPTWRKNNPSAAPVLILALTSTSLPSGVVYEAAETILAQQLSQMEGVGQVTVNGSEKPAVRVQVNPAALASMGLGLEDVRAALNAVNAAGPKGRVDATDGSYVIRVNDQMRWANEYRSVIVTTRHGTPIRLDAVASVIDSVENVRTSGWFNNQPAVLVFVFREVNANVIETVDRIHELLPTLRAWLPPAVDLSVMSDRTETIRASVHEIELCLVISLGLIVTTVFLFLRRLWATMAAAITIPLSIAGTFGVMYLFGYTIDNMSLMALTVATGFIVDDAIVVLEAISRRMGSRESPFQAAWQAARQIGFTVASISVSLIAALIPLLFMGGIIGRLFREFAVTLALAIAVSAIVSLTLIPVMGAYLGHTRRGREKPPLEFIFQKLLAGYEAALVVVLRHRGATLTMMGASILATVVLWIEVPKGFFPQQDTGAIVAIAEAPMTVSFQAMTRRVQALMSILLNDAAVARVGSYTGQSGATSNQARIFIALKPLAERGLDTDRVIARLRRATREVQGVALYMVPVQEVRVGGRISKAQYQYSITGPDLGELETWAGRLVERLKDFPDLRDVTTDLELGALQAMLVIDRDAAGRLQVAPNDIDQTLYDAFGQRLVSSIYAPHYTYHVVLEASPELQEDPSSLAKVYVAGPGGKQVPLGNVVRVEHAIQMSAVAHQGQAPAVTLTFSMRPGLPIQRGTEIVEREMRELGAPSHVRGSFQGNARAFTESLATQPMLIAVALFAVYVVLGVLYESTIHPVTILSTLPSAGVGAILALWAIGRPLDLIGMIGIILLIGIVKKNAIMLIDFALVAEREHGRSPEQAIFEACRLRFRPILMTTIAAILGAVPLAVGLGVGSELRQPLGISIIGGLLVSQVLTLFTTPVVYLALDRLRSDVERSSFEHPSSRTRTEAGGAGDIAAG
ncbi:MULTISPECIES: efflux RND transporter permease subunit [unclassified Bradyrhizobium]|uniref:efflux RND transporter permease subunit n=1 Tax=unclassified Bradyrhizobium TaxID=2631580 RepID=UPI001FFB1FC3|nr:MULTISPECIES: efflux RND transporter permease subunit [unclassified Bradyrhizobium]MCK1710804.1 efflux RND transporter permease subunit [Bradyrhizobium sp. 143]MCK1724482.1 efflux RND transporter permease subunit [Bradyrhizobium sp. 142]